MTPQQVNDAIRQRYNAEGDTFFGEAMIWDLIYQGQMIMAQEAFVIERKYTAVSVASTREYDFPTSAISVRRIEYDGKKMLPVTVDQDPKTSTTEVSGTPGEYAVWNNKLILYPTPSASGDTITIYTYNEPQPVTATSTLEIPTEYHLDLIEFALGSLSAKDGNGAMAKYFDERWFRCLERVKRTAAKKRRGDGLSVVRDENTFSVVGG